MRSAFPPYVIMKRIFWFGTLAHLTADLCKQDPGFQDFVIAHELLHFRVPTHGRLFRALLSLYFRTGGRSTSPVTVRVGERAPTTPRARLGRRRARLSGRSRVAPASHRRHSSRQDCWSA